MKPSPDTLRKLPDVDKLMQESDPALMVSNYFPESEQALTAKGMVETGAFESLELPAAETELPGSINNERMAVVEAGWRGLEKISADGEDAELTPAENFGLEAIIVLEGRPAILLQRGELLQVPDEWSVLNDLKDDINQTARSVGRIEVSGHPSFDWVGTGFLVADDVVMTNRHVAEAFCHRPPRKRTWRFKPGMSGQIDYMEEWGNLDKAEFEFRSVIGVHDVYDMALFRVRRISPSGVEPPQPLTIASESPEDLDNHKVYACGYPAWDGRRNEPAAMMRIFANIFNVKRLQPGELRQFHANSNIVEHDCSTLGGNSGSCVVDLDTNRVVGLHFGGRFQQANKAVALWQLTDDPLLVKAGVNFA
jgi:hypothetical protein